MIRAFSIACCPRTAAQIGHSAPAPEAAILTQAMLRISASHAAAPGRRLPGWRRSMMVLNQRLGRPMK
jgi:hypothetical protein